MNRNAGRSTARQRVVDRFFMAAAFGGRGTPTGRRKVAMNIGWNATSLKYSGTVMI